MRKFLSIILILTFISIGLSLPSRAEKTEEKCSDAINFLNGQYIKNRFSNDSAKCTKVTNKMIDLNCTTAMLDTLKKKGVKLNYDCNAL